MIDATDRAILKALQADATLSAGAIGRSLGLSQPAAWRRIRALQDKGVFAGRRVRVDQAALGFGVTVFLGIKLATKGRVSLEDFERAATAIPEVQVVQHVLGQFDYRLRVTARDIADFERVLRRRIMTLPGVGDIEANVLLSEERLAGPLSGRCPSCLRQFTLRYLEKVEAALTSTFSKYLRGCGGLGPPLRGSGVGDLVPH